MNIFLHTAIPFPSPFAFPKISSTIISKPVKACAAQAVDSIYLLQEMLQPVKSVQEKKHNDIWQLFSEAWQNIMFLNNQRMVAMEELDKMKRENEILLDRIEQLEMKKQNSCGKDRLFIKSDLLPRIDSMVLTGMISTGEAAGLRMMILDSKVSVADDFSDIHHKNDAELLAELRHFSDKCKKKCFHIVHVCTEMEPVIPVGSLASYVTGISCALQRKGHFVEVVLPKYAGLILDEVQGLREIEAEFYSYFNGQLHNNKIWTCVVHGIGITFIQPIFHSSFFSRERVYGYADDFERFSYFSRASLDYILRSGKQPDVIHIHNWQTAIVGPLFWDVFSKQCLVQPDKLALCGLEPSRLHRPDRLQDNTKTHLVNILKGGIVYSNKVILLSSIHSKGLIIRSLSHGLEPTLAIHMDKLLVAPCGFDDSIWNPSTDHYLPQRYSADDMKGKAVCKVALQKHMGLSENASLVLVGCMFSEVSDVDLENIKALVWIASKKGVQFIFMGLSKISSVALESLQEELKDDNVIFIKEYEEAMSHLIFAGSDVILCQSFDDPVLQVLLKAIRYGAAPVATNLVDKQFRLIIDHDFERTNFSQYISNVFGSLSLSQAIDEIVRIPRFTF
ncbi:hypothetical protein RHGRI_028972 [Rhododendron griersonianum]|uniref:starch synthase n=1 Tax=Rhododendron griersonianum TaxID=479676 RepID=A0AAV6IIK3_9ERIC|nr:hypothetical protein RHGRI_028972 [Rhododendron griersonianum]